MDSQVILSFSKWPVQVMDSNRYKLSPTTSKILKSADVQVESLLPLSKEQFIISNNLSTKNKQQTQELYREEKQRRVIKVQILHSLWDRVSQKHKKRKSQYSSDFLKRQKVSTSQRNSNKSGSVFKKNKKTSPIIFKARSPKKNSAYFDYYSNSKDGKVSVGLKKYSNEDQSTKSRQNIKDRLNSKFSPNKDYFGSHQKKVNKKHQKNDTTTQQKKTQVCLQLLDEMNLAMQKWTQLDMKHRDQMVQMGQISERQKKRLIKIQQIEKQKLKQQIEDIRTRLTASKQLGKHLF